MGLTVQREQHPKRSYTRSLSGLKSRNALPRLSERNWLFFGVFSMVHPVASDSFPLTGSGSVSTLDGIYIAANLGGHSNRLNYSRKAALHVVKGRGLYPNFSVIN